MLRGDDSRLKDWVDDDVKKSVREFVGGLVKSALIADRRNDESGVRHDNDVLAIAAEGGEVGVGSNVAYPPEVPVRTVRRCLLLGELVGGGLLNPWDETSWRPCQRPWSR